MSEGCFTCQGCGRPAPIHVFLAEAAWNQIAPNHDRRTGVLCLYCMSDRLAALGWSEATAPCMVSNGPLANVRIGDPLHACPHCGGSGKAVQPPTEAAV